LTSFSRGESGRRGRQAILPQGFGGGESSSPSRHQRGRQSVVPQGREEAEAGAGVGSTLPVSNLPLPPNNIIEQDHRAIKRRINAKQGFRSLEGAQRTIPGYEVMHMIRKGQVRWLLKGDVIGQVLFINLTLGLTCSL
jgi:DDE domain